MVAVNPLDTRFLMPRQFRETPATARPAPGSPRPQSLAQAFQRCYVQPRFRPGAEGSVIPGSTRPAPGPAAPTSEASGLTL